MIIDNDDAEIIDIRDDLPDSSELPLPPNNSGGWRAKRKKYLREFLALASIVLLACSFRSVGMELFKIPTGSMIPTLRIGDFILVNKYAYGLKFPFSDITYFSRRPEPIYLTEQKPVERGDVIVFKYPKDPSINYIKRVIGIPGDTVEIKDKFVFINGTKIEVSKVSGQDLMKTMDEKYRDNNLSFYQAEFKNKSFIYQIDNDNFFKVDFDKITIPKGQYFVMGDNRDFSYDSRYWGLVPRSHLVGKAVVVWLSIDFNPSGQESLELRSDRIGHLIQ